MSYEIIKAISVKGNQIFITSNSNNVYPRIPKQWLSTYYTELLQKEGQKAVDLSLLQDFIDGNAQGISTLYGKICNAYSNLSANEMYEKYIMHKNDKTKYIIKRGNNYFYKTTSRRAFLTDEKNHAKTYKAIDASLLGKRFENIELIAV